MSETIDRTWSRAEGMRVSFYAAPVGVRAVGILPDVPSDGRTPSLGSSCPDPKPAARDNRPDILERMKGGRFTSVRKVSLEAGIVKPEFSIPVEPHGPHAGT
jgi:hypothetical protein